MLTVVAGAEEAEVAPIAVWPARWLQPRPADQATSPAISAELCEHGLLFSVSVCHLLLKGRQLLDSGPTLIHCHFLLTDYMYKDLISK